MPPLPHNRIRIPITQVLMAIALPVETERIAASRTACIFAPSSNVGVSAHLLRMLRMNRCWFVMRGIATSIVFQSAWWL